MRAALLLLLLAACTHAASFSAGGGGISAGDQAKLDALEISGTSMLLKDLHLQLSTGYHVIANVFRGRTGESVAIRDGASNNLLTSASGSEVVVLDADLQHVHARKYLGGATGDGWQVNDNGGTSLTLDFLNGGSTAGSPVYRIQPESGQFRGGPFRGSSVVNAGGSSGAPLTLGADFTCAALPGSPVAGMVRCDSADSNKLKHYDGSTWNALY